MGGICCSLCLFLKLIHEWEKPWDPACSVAIWEALIKLNVTMSDDTHRCHSISSSYSFSALTSKVYYHITQYPAVLTDAFVPSTMPLFDAADWLIVSGNPN